jgi:hypothetical protein
MLGVVVVPQTTRMTVFAVNMYYQETHGLEHSHLRDVPFSKGFKLKFSLIYAGMFSMLYWPVMDLLSE